jgi:hypothetical protein
MSEKEESIRNGIGSDYIIGCYQKQDDGSSCFVDIRGDEGELLDIPEIGDDDIVIPYSDSTLEVGSFYRFQWKLLEKEDRLAVVGKAIRVNNTEFLQGIFNARLSLKGTNLELANNIQKTILNEVTGAQHTYIYELLQNANDYPYKKDEVEVKFILTDHYLFFLHSGDYFNLKNIVGISSINQGEKAKNTETIGYKGIGFKTVFVNNEYVYLKSGDWSLRFDREYSEKKKSRKCPWALMPIPTSKEDLDDEVISTLASIDEKMRVRFALRHKSNARNNLEQLDKVFGDNQILLFIPHVYKVDVIVDGKSRYKVEKDENKWVISHFSYPVPPDLKTWVEANINSGEKVPEKFRNIKNVGISFAVSRNKGELRTVENARVYNYLPTELRLGFKFLINADFIPNGSRSGLHDVKWNDCVMEQCGYQFAEWWSSFMTDGTSFDIESVFSLLPELTSHDHYGSLFLKGFSKRIVEIPCIPVLHKGKYKQVKLNELILDKCGIIVSDNPVLSDEEFYQFSKKIGYLAHPFIRNNKHLLRLLNHFDTSVVFNGNDLTNLAINMSFQKWLTNKDNNIKFVGYLLKSGYLMNFWNYPIFLKADGNLGIANTIYYDIDKYIEDISFLASNLPRLDVGVRDSLANISPEWVGNSSKFKQFREDSFVSNILMNYGYLKNKFAQKDNSVHFLHFLAIIDYADGIPEGYPLFTEEGKSVSNKEIIFQKNKIGEDLASHKWINKVWIQFLHPDYTAKDKDKVKNYLSARCRITALSAKDCFTNFIAKDKRVEVIAENIKDIESSVDFYRYLSEIQEDIGNFTQSMRLNYTLLTTDGRQDSWTPITKTIFWKDDDWEEVAKVKWMPDDCCVSVSDVYFKGLVEEESKALKTLFSTKQLVQQFRIQTLFASCLRPRIDDIFNKITNKELSCEFLDFLFENRNYIFKENTPIIIFKGVPILCVDEKALKPLRSISCPVFAPGEDVNELYEQPWFDRLSIRVCDASYAYLFDGKERQSFFEKIGIRNFNKVEFAREYQLNNLESLHNKLKERECNVSFYRYFSEIHDDLSENEMAALKELPIFISSPDNELGVLVDKSTNHYLPSKQLTEIISLDLVPLSILDSIHPDYIVSDKDKKFYTEKLTNYELELDEFFAYIAREEENVTPYLKDVERNKRFWKWACSQTLSNDDKKELSCFPLLCRKSDSDNDLWRNAKDLYISDAYSEGIEIEDFIREYVNDAQFISSAYAEMDNEGQELQWKSLFKAMGMTVDVKEIVFKKVLKNLANIKKKSIVNVLSQYVDVFAKNIQAKDEVFIKQIGNLQLLCDDGDYKSAKNVLVSGKYFDLPLIPFPEVIIGNLVSEQYILDCGENEELKRNVTKLITLIADTFKVKCETATQLRDYKLKYFLSHQRDFTKNDDHYRIIAQLNEAYNKDADGVEKLLEGTPTLLLYNSNNILVPAHSLYLSTAYHPACDYMANGISDLEFVSERYVEYSQQSYNRFFRINNIKDSFSLKNLPQLANEQFSIYFWKTYAVKNEFLLTDILTEENLKGIPCIPSPTGISKPSELYDNRKSQLKKMVLRLKDGVIKLPSIELPGWMKDTHIGFRGKLYLPDCLEYLNLNIGDFRRDVMGWIIETPDETLKRYSRRIKEYTDQALWLNGEKKWVPLSELKALEWENKTLKDNFGGNAYVCNPSYMPEFKWVYDKICDIFHIQILTNNDFQKRKEGKSFKDIDAITEIRKRLLYLAYKSGDDKWKEVYDEYNEKLSAADISSVERIVYFFNDNIETDLQIYAEEESALWYVGGWKGPMFLAVLDWIINKIGIKGGFDNNFLQKLFLGNFRDFIMRQEGGLLPQDLLDCLDEVDKEGLEVDDLAGAERFVEDTTSEEEDNEDISDSESDNIEPQQEQFERKPVPAQTSKPATDRKRERSLESSNSSSEKEELSRSIERTNKKNETSNTPRKTTEEKLKEEFEEKAQRSVGRPTSSQRFDLPMEPSIKNAPDDSPSDPLLGMDNPIQDGPSRNNYMSSSSKASQTINRRNTEAQNLAEHAAEQVDIWELWQNTPEYSYLWFKYLMKLQNGDKVKASRRTIQIDFGEYELKCDNKILTLSSPSVVVPTWIENASISMLAIGNGSIKISGSVVKVDDMEVDIMINPDDVAKLRGVKKIRFNAESLTNIIDSLEIRFLQLGYEDDYDMEENLPDDISFIYGPPGTGKTTRLVERLHDIVTGANSKLNILVLTPTNKAADVIALKLADDDDCYNYLTRFGSTECVSLIEDYAVLQTRDTIDMELLSHNIVVTTAARYAYDYFETDDLAICDFKWDYIVFDEASMIDLITITYVLHKAKDSKFIIAGDPKQIQPISDVIESNVYNLVGLDSFKDAIESYKRYPVEALKIQHRSVPSIGNLVSQFTYDGLVGNDIQRAPQKPLALDGIPVKDVNFIGFKIDDFGDYLYSLSAIDESAFHLYSAIFTYNMVDYSVRQITEKYPKAKYTIGIVCPYKAEANAVGQLLERRPLDTDVCTVTSGTVHRFQGDECDIMFIILNPPSNVTSGTHINNVNIINVAMSRARDYVFFIVPDKHVNGFNKREELWSLVDDKDKTVQTCDKIEEIMFGNSRYIYENTNVTPHLPVNVYYDTHALYEVRVDETAIDIQINDEEI